MGEESNHHLNKGVCRGTDFLVVKITGAASGILRIELGSQMFKMLECLQQTVTTKNYPAQMPTAFALGNINLVAHSYTGPSVSHAA